MNKIEEILGEDRYGSRKNKETSNSSLLTEERMRLGKTA